AIESGVARMDNGREEIFIRGVTKVRGGSALARKLPQFFAPASSSDDEISAARAPIDAHINAQSEKADRTFRAEQASHERPAIAPANELEVLIGFRTEKGVTHGVGEIVDRT